MAVTRRGEVAILTLNHPILGTPLEVGAHSIRIGPEQYLALVDGLCNIAFLSPRFAVLIHDMARDLKVPEVGQYIAWLREADARALARANQPEAPARRQARTRPAPEIKFEGKAYGNRNREDRPADAGGGSEFF